MKTVAQKMGIKENAKSYIVNAPKEVIRSLNLPNVEIVKDLTGVFDFIYLSNKVVNKNLFFLN